MRPAVSASRDFPISSPVDLTIARRSGLNMALKAGFVMPDATKIAVVISELARNILNYADGGNVTVIVFGSPRKGIKIIARDQGPGIEDVNLVLSGHYTSAKGLGVGLSGSKKMMDEFEILSMIGKGTVITAVKWLY